MEVFLIALIVGVLIGLLSGLLGIGGGTVMVPVFRLGFGMTAIQATATSLFTIVPTSVAGCVNHIRNKTCIIPLGIATGLGGACTSMVGVWLASISPSWAIILAAACVIAFSAITMLKKALKMKPAAASKAHSPLQSVEDPVDKADQPTKTADAVAGPTQAGDNERTMSKRELCIGAAIGLAAGLASGYVGVGGGFLMVPLFIALLGVPMKKASGTSLIAIIIVCIPGAFEQMLLGNVHVMAGVAMAIGSIPGALVGANLIRSIPERTLRFMFGALLLVVAAIMAVNEFSPLFQ